MRLLPEQGKRELKSNRVGKEEDSGVRVGEGGESGSRTE